MKFNFKRIASVLTSAVMLSSTVALAAATAGQYPDPFVKNGVADVAVVYGGTPAALASTDVLKAQEIANKLGVSQVSAVTSVTTPAVIAGESKPVQTESQKLYLGDYMNTTKSTFTKDNLPTVLAGGKLTDDDGKDISYELKVDVPKTNVIYGDTSDNLATPVIYTDFDSSAKTYTLRLVFTTAVNVSKITDETIKLFGKTYSVSGSTSDLDSSTQANGKLTLFEKSTSVKINDGESTTVNGHTVSVDVEDATTASITVDGVSASKAEGWSGKINGIDIYVKNVVGPNVAGTARFAELYFNSNKVVLRHGNAVTVGSNDITGTSVSFTVAGGKASEVAITVTPNSLSTSTKYLKYGDSFTDPVFGTLKFGLLSTNPDLNSTARDDIIMRPSGETKVSLEFKNRNSQKYNLDVLKVSKTQLLSTYAANTSGENDGVNSGTINTYNATTLGVDNYKLVVQLYNANAGTKGPNQINVSDYFITCDGEYTQIWRLNSLSIGSTTKMTLVDQGDSGSGTNSQEFTFTSPNMGATASFSLAGGSSATAYLSGNESGFGAINVTNACSYLYTKNGARIDLSTANAPYSNLSYVNISEKTAYNGGTYNNNLAGVLGNNVTARFTWLIAGRSGKDMELKTVTYGGTSLTDYWTASVGDYDQYTLTKWGTYGKQTGDTDKQLELLYPKDAMNVGFYIGELTSSTTETSGAVGTALFFKDSEVTSFSNKNLIVVGGSCVNTAAQKLLGVTTPLCGADFTAKTGIGAGQYLIQTFASPYNSSKIATLVAGYEAQQTVNAVDYLLTQNVSTTTGSKYATGVKQTVGPTA